MIKSTQVVVRPTSWLMIFGLLFALLSGSFNSFAAEAKYLNETSTDGVAANPATDGGVDKSRTRFDYLLNPGQPAEDSIYVINTGTTSQEVTLYARDAFTDEKGEFLIRGQDEPARDVATWVKFYNKKDTFTKTLKPREFMTVPFALATPTNASPGDHIGAIVVSASTKGENINVVRRVAVRLYARVSGQVKARLTISNLSVETSVSLWNPFQSSQKVSYDITNDGNIELSADVSAQATGPGSISFNQSETIRVTELLPGDSRHVEQIIPGAGQLVVSNTTVIATGIFASANAAAQQPRTRKDFSSAVWPVGLLFYLAATGVASAAFVVFAKFRSRRSDSEWPDEAFD